MYVVGCLPKDKWVKFINLAKKILFAIMRLVSLHTCTANDSIKEALKRAFLSLNDITIRFDGRQPRSLIGMRKLAINQHLDLPEHIHEDDSTPEGEWRYSELQASVDCTAPTTSHCGYSHITVVCWSRKVSETAATAIWPRWSGICLCSDFDQMQ